MNHPASARRHARLVLAATVAAALLAGCWGGDDDNGTTGSTAVPGSAFASSDSFVTYLRGLALNDTDEPLTIDGTSVPPLDDTSEPTPLS